MVSPRINCGGTYDLKRLDPSHFGFLKNILDLQENKLERDVSLVLLSSPIVSPLLVPEHVYSGMPLSFISLERGVCIHCSVNHPLLCPLCKDGKLPPNRGIARHLNHDRTV